MTTIISRSAAATLPAGATLPAPAGLPRWRAGALAALLEALAVAASIALLWPAFEQVAELGEGRDQRFAETGWRVAGLPPPVLPALCALGTAPADGVLRERLCGAAPGATAALPDTPAGALPPVLEEAVARAGQALLAPLREAQVQVQRLRLQQDAGAADPRDLADAMAAIEATSRPYAERFALAHADAVAPLPLECAVRWVRAALAETQPPAPSPAPPAAPARPTAQAQAEAQAQAKARANALLLLGAALDGRAATAVLAASVALPAPARDPAAPCDAPQLSAAAALSATAALLGQTRQSVANARKNEAMVALLGSAGVQWAGAMLIGFGLLRFSRSARSPLLGVAVALALWGLAAWLARVPWPLAAQRQFVAAGLAPVWTSAPPVFVIGLLALAALLALAGIAPQRWPGRPGRRAGIGVAQAPASCLGYAGLVLTSGLGALLLLDLSASGHPVNRYLALYHQGHLWLGMLLFSVLLFVRQPLGRALGRGLSLGAEVARRARRRFGTARALLALLLGSGAALLVAALALSNLRQLTSELGRLWLIVGAAWFLFMRAGPLAERLAAFGPAGRSLLRYAAPLLFVVGVLVAFMLVTRDMGPLLIAAYACGAFLAAMLAMWAHARTRHGAPAGWLAYGLAGLLFAAWIGMTTLALFMLGGVDELTATRLESLAAPLASTNDQLALVAWFQRAAPLQGFGIGAVPWCGHAPAGGCSGVPAQVHSDYTFTALVGVFGTPAAWAATLGCAVWLHRLIRHHGRATPGEPRLVRRGGQLVSDGQALLSWIGVAWVVLTMCQLAVTVAGNVAVLPLTGVTFPFVSFGMTSLLVNLAFLALCLNVDAPDARPAHH